MVQSTSEYLILSQDLFSRELTLNGYFLESIDFN